MAKAGGSLVLYLHGLHSEILFQRKRMLEGRTEEDVLLLATDHTAIYFDIVNYTVAIKDATFEL